MNIATKKYIKMFHMITLFFIYIEIFFMLLYNKCRYTYDIYS